MQTITATDFKARCLGILDRLSRHELNRVVITKRGLPFGVLTPHHDEVASVEGSDGCMKGSVTIAEGVDMPLPFLTSLLTLRRA